MRVERRDKRAAANMEIRAKYPSGVATVIKGYKASIYYSLTEWAVIESAKIGEVVNRPAYNSNQWHGPIGTRMSHKDLQADGWITRADYIYSTMDAEK